MSKNLRETDPTLSPALVIGTGATDVRNVFGPTDLPFVLDGYVKGIQTAFIVGIALACFCTLSAFLSPIKKMEPAEKPAQVSSADISTENIKKEAAV